jgi:choline-sulfatase
VTRKEFFQVSAGLAAEPGFQGKPKPAGRPNVVVLLTDQHRPDLLSCEGSDLVPTPNMDRIAGRGVRFRHAYCPYPVCAPSRMSLLTGLYAHHHLVANNLHRLDWKCRTVAHTFRDNGYLTALIGKMHFNDGNSHGFDFRLGFNDWLMYLGPKVHHYADEIASYPGYENRVYDTGSGFPDVEGLWKDNRSPWIGNVAPRKEVSSELIADDHIDAFVARESSKFIRAHKDQPFFLVAGFLRPHAPFHPPKDFAAWYPAENTRLPPIGDLSRYPSHIRKAAAQFQSMGEETLKKIRAGYLGNLRFVDTCIGEVYKTLEDLNLIDNTIVVYTSDHGEMGGDHGLFQKFVFFEPSVGVPLIISYPKSLPQGKVSEALVEYLGIYPTLAELAGLPMSGKVDGASLVPWLKNPGGRGPEAAFAEYALSWAPRYMVRTRRYKFNYNEGDLAELYDLEDDPGERVNRSGDPSLSKVEKNLRDQLFAWYDPGANPFKKSGQLQR